MQDRQTQPIPEDRTNQQAKDGLSAFQKRMRDRQQRMAKVGASVKVDEAQAKKFLADFKQPPGE